MSHHGRPAAVVRQESAAVQHGDEGVQAYALHERVPCCCRVCEAVPEGMRLCHTGVLQHQPAT